MSSDDTHTESESPSVGCSEATRAHVIPFVTWMLLVFLLPRVGVHSAAGYALRTGACLALLLWLRPWRWYGRLEARNVALAVVTGLGVCAVWVAPETDWFIRATGSFYATYLMLPFGKPPEQVALSAFAPELCGWPLALVRLLGSAFVIAVIEEFFWRGFLYRWLRDQDFLTLDLGCLDWRFLLLTSLLFGFEHQRWFAGILAGLAYGWLAVRTRDLWAASLAHVVTNFLLGLYVLGTGSFAFW